jgi:superfamily II DNA or RNA helicase
MRQQTAEKARAFSASYKKRRGMTDEQLVELHTQPLPVNAEQTPEAIHRTLTALPNGAVAFKPIGTFTDRDRTTLREHFLKNIAGIDPAKEREEQAAQVKQAAEKKAAQPVAHQVNIFGEVEEVTQAQALGEAPEGEAAKEPSRASKAWDGYVKAMGGHQAAYETLQADLKGEAVKAYAKNHAQVFGQPLKLGTERLPNWEGHLIGRMPEEKLRAALGAKYEEAARLMSIVAKRGPGGRYAAEEGSRKQAADQLMAMMKEHQLGLFEQAEMPSLERPTIGRDAEQKLGSVWNKAAERFDPKGSAVSLIPDLSMSGDKMKQQRAVKLAVENRRMGLHFGAGSGKSLISIGAFTQLHSEGKATKAVYAVPSAVLSQFGGEMMRFTEPGKYRWLADPSASREDRFAAYADPDTHMVVATHQAFRDDLMHAISRWRQEDGKEPGSLSDTAAWLGSHDEATQRKIIKQATDHHGWKVDFFAVDEAQGILNRAGKPDSSMARTLDGFSYHMPNYLSMTGTPVKNDASEGFDVLKKLHPDRFTDRDAFMRRYAGNTPAAKRSLQRLMARYVYTDRIPSGVNRYTDVRNMPLTPKQQAAYDQVEQALAKVRATRRGGKVDVAAARTLAPEAFEGKPEAEHPTIAAELAKSGLGGRVEHRRAAIVNQFDFEHNAKVHALRDDLTAHKEKPHVIFAHNYGSVAHIQRVCKELGLKAGLVSGDQSAKDKAKVRTAFQAGELDVIVNTDAGSTGQNLQRGSVLINYDTPDTAMTHEQRIARVDRIGQQNDVTVRDYVTDTPYERRARRRLERKQALADVFQSPSDNLDDSGLAAEIQSVRAEKRNKRKAA